MTGGQVGDHTTQRTVVTHIVDDPKLDFGSLMRDAAVSRALAEVSRDPMDPDTRAAAVEALSMVRATGEDWTTAFASVGTAQSHRSGNWLDGTVAIIHSRGVQVGDRAQQVNEIVYSLSPDIDAAAMLTHPDVANSLIDVATRPGDRTAAKAFDAALSAGLCSELALSEAARGCPEFRGTSVAAR